MGLDVSLYRITNFDDHLKREKIENDAYEEIYKDFDYQEATAGEKVAKEKELKELIEERAKGLDVLTERIEEDSKIDPDNMFKIGYFRSSYNSGGINSVLGEHGLPTLYEIFPEADFGGEYWIKVDWNDAKKQVQSAIKGLEKTMEELKGYGAMKLSVGSRHHADKLPKSKKAAIEYYQEQTRGENSPDFESWINFAGFTTTKAIDVVGVYNSGEKDFLGDEEIYLVYRTDKGKGDLDWYLTALKIVEETIDYVLAQENPEEYYLGWSS